MPGVPGRSDSASKIPRPPLDAVDQRLVDLLVGDGRLSVNELAKRAGVSRATAYARYDRLLASGVVTGFRATVDPHALGLGIAALIFVNVQQGSWQTAQERMLELPGLEWLALTSGGFDIVLLVRFADVETLRDVVLVHLHGMAEVRSTQTVFLLDEYGPETAPTRRG
jgi:DNA-binding Lrp family transcriptional regulator